MVFPCRSRSSESLPSSPVTDTQAAGPAPTSPPHRAVYRQKFQWGLAGGRTLHIPSSLTGLTGRNASKPAHVVQRRHSPPVSAGWSCWRHDRNVHAQLTDWLRWLRRARACARASCSLFMCVCFFFLCVVRIRRAAFSQEPAWAQWAQSAAPGPVINAASGGSEKQPDEKASHHCSIQLKEFPFASAGRKGALCAPVGSGPSVLDPLCGVCPEELQDIKPDISEHRSCSHLPSYFTGHISYRKRTVVDSVTSDLQFMNITATKHNHKPPQWFITTSKRLITWQKSTVCSTGIIHCRNKE